MTSPLEELRLAVGLSTEALWLAAYAVGSTLTREQLDAALLGTGPLTRREYAFLAVAFDEAANEAGLSLRAPPWEDLRQPDSR